ncbi:hypothetical protein MRX96_012629 [Rhipicephalus microplus]
MISDVLQGKHKPIFSPTSDCGDHVVVTNCSEIAMPWYEWKYRMYFHDTRFAGGRSWTPAWQVQDKDATKVLWKAVYRALPGDLNRRTRMARLHLFPDDKVPREIIDNISGQLRQLRRALKKLVDEVNMKIIQCEWLFAGIRTPVDTIDAGESSDEETLSPSLSGKASSVFRHALYYVTDSERFAPPRKKPIIITKLYRLLCVKSTTPEELFAAKIDAEEYGEAIGFGSNLMDWTATFVYQRQWRRSSASVAAIQDYLSKIKKCTWVIHECMERVPENLEAARQLLEFRAPRHGCGGPGCMWAGQKQWKVQKQKAATQQWRKEWLTKVDFHNLSLDQRWLCECRLKLLLYLDRLAMYEIYEELTLSPEKFDAEFFESFRCQPPLEAALSFAQEGNAPAVSTLFTYAGVATLPHWLTVMSNFPETLPPSHYSTCLPKARITEQGTREVISWDTQDLREKDWCEEMIQEAPMVAVWNAYDKDFYDDNPLLQKWWTEEPTCEMLTQWYSERAHEIEEMTSLVDNAFGAGQDWMLEQCRGSRQALW